MRAIFSLLLALPLVHGSSESFPRHLRAVDASVFEAELQSAMGEALGCGGLISEQHLLDLEEELRVVYATLPKNGVGRIDRRSLRFLAYRYFNQKHALVIRGFEPSRPLNDSAWAAEVLSQRVPNYVESVLMSRHALERGFDIRDAALLITTIEQLMFDSESNLLEKVYKELRKPLDKAVPRQSLQQVLEAYLVHWLMGNDEEGVRILLNNAKLRQKTFPHWDELVQFANGEIKAQDFKSAKQAKKGALELQYSFEDAHSVIGGITRSFASFWESECVEMKDQLIEMDPHRTGRVPLSKFYGTGLEADWRFAESEAYLRELGALDESSGTKQVLIPNYIQAASNCIVATSHYMVCCLNDCNPLMAEIETALKAPSATPEQLLAVVANMSSAISLEDERAPRLEGMAAQLQAIAANHNGEVPIHGRRFLQWLHYVFPQQCPFPHLSGTTAALAPQEFKGDYVASQDAMMAEAKSELPDFNSTEELWMSQWSEEEELMAGYEGLDAKVCGLSRKLGLACFGLAAMLGVVGFNRKGTGKEGDLLPSYQSKAHYI
mmetsp:Transcript_25371/g.60365  ORF Transcript_25371/g.60365 Transcript_25371/m.60365 type:complete len:551 (-) Transcript_25371:88-1740(-)